MGPKKPQRKSIEMEKKNSGTGNRTPGVCVTGRNVTNYTMPEKKRLQKNVDREFFQRRGKSLWSTPVCVSMSDHWPPTGGFFLPQTANCA